MRRSEKLKKRRAQATRQAKRESREQRRLMLIPRPEPFRQPPVFYVISAIMAGWIGGIILISVLWWYGYVVDFGYYFNVIGYTGMGIIMTLAVGDACVGAYRTHKKRMQTQLQEE